MLDSLSSQQRKILYILIDSFSSYLVVTIAVLLSKPVSFISENIRELIILSAFISISKVFFFNRFKLYSILWRYASSNDILRLVKVISLYTLIIFGSYKLFESSITEFIHLNTLFFVTEWQFTIILLGGIRLGLRLFREKRKYSAKTPFNEIKHVAIIGAGDAGELVARQLQSSDNDIKLVGFIDDNTTKHGQVIHQVPVICTIDDLPNYYEQYKIDEILICMPSAPGKTIRKIITICNKINISYKITPGLFEILSERVSVNQLRDIRIDDLLGRKAIISDLTPLHNFFQQKNCTDNRSRWIDRF